MPARPSRRATKIWCSIAKQLAGHHVVARQDDTAIRFSLRQLLTVTGYLAFTVAVVVNTGSIALGIHLSLGLVGWIMWRFAHGHLGGIIPALLGGDFLLCSSVVWVVQGSEDFMGVRSMFNVLASLLVLVGLAGLIWIGMTEQRFWKHQMGIAAAIGCILVAWWIAIPALGHAAIASRRAADTAANNLAAAKGIVLVEDVRKRTGTTTDADRLEELLTEPIPSVRWDGNSQQIRYQRTGDTTYQLSYIDSSMFWGDTVTYDSATPTKGWYRIPF